MTGFHQISLGDVLTLQRGFDITKSEQTDGEIPIVSSSGISSYHNKWKVKGPGVVIGRKGTLGTVHFIQSNYWPHDTTLWIKDFKGNDPRFLSYFLQTLKLENFDVGASNPTLNRNHVHKIKIIFPKKLDIQKRIAATLSAYDELIEINQRHIALLEKMTKEIYREWFVRLRFPGHVNTRKVKGVPEGWKIGKLCDITCSVKEKYVDLDHQKWPLVDLEKMTQRSLAVANTGDPSELTTSRILFARNDILFSTIRPYLYKVNMAPSQGVTNTSVMVLRSRIPEYRSFVTMTLFMDSTIAWADQYSTGTKMPVISWNVFQKMELFDPGLHLAAKFNDLVSPTLDQINSLSILNRRLAQSRDLLLPRLISGKLSVESLDIQFPPSMEETAHEI